MIVFNFDKISDAELRNHAFKALEYVLASQPIPYYISADPDGPKLPMVTKLGH